jgi:membrane protein required for colicin V production
MNYLDWILFILIGIGMVKGLTDGLVRQLISLAGIIVGSWVAIKYADVAAKFLLTLYDFPVYVWKPLAFFILFITIIILANLLATIFQKVLDGIGLGPLNHVAGAIFGGIKFVLIISIALNLFQLFDKNNRIIKSVSKSESISYYPLLKVSPTIFPYLQNYFHQEKEIEIKDKKEVVG